MDKYWIDKMILSFFVQNIADNVWNASSIGVMDINTQPTTHYDYLYEMDGWVKNAMKELLISLTK